MNIRHFPNPVGDYFNWLKIKISYQRKYKKEQLNIGYMTQLRQVKFGKYNWTGNRVYLENTEVGDFSYFSDNCVVLEATIGKFCSFGPNVMVAPGKHPTRTFVSTHPALFSNPPYCKKNFFDQDYHHPERHVTIGNDVWICANAVIADGVTVGDGAIVGANAVVTSDVEPYSIVGGVPARHIRYRFEPDEVDFLCSIKWWDKGIEWIEAHAGLFLNIKDFMALTNSTNGKSER